MGSLAGITQLNEVKERVAQLSEFSKIVYGTLDFPEIIGTDSKAGAFMSPILLLNEFPFKI